MRDHEEQYSIWPADRPLPVGWRPAGKTGSKPDCLDHIDQEWTDMRPLSLRQQLAAAQVCHHRTITSTSGN